MKKPVPVPVICGSCCASFAAESAVFADAPGLYSRVNCCASVICSKLICFSKASRSGVISLLFTAVMRRIQMPFAPVVHPKMILAAAVFPRPPECARSRAQQRGKAGRHRFRQSAWPFVCAISKAPEGWRSPRRFARFACHRQTLAFWTAPALHRFSS